MVVGSGRHIVSKSRLCHVFRAHSAAMDVRKSVDKQVPDATRTIDICSRRRSKEAKKKTGRTRKEIQMGSKKHC